MDKKKKSIDLSTLVYGKVPPQAKEVEEVILGALLMDGATASVVKELITPDDFYVDAHQRICKAIFKVSEKNAPELVLIGEELKANDEIELIGGLYYLLQLTNKVTGDSVHNIKKHCLIVKERSIKRRLIKLAGIIINDAYEDSEEVFDLLMKAEGELKMVNNELSDMKITPISNVAMRVIEKFDNRVEKARQGIEDTDSIYTGMAEWDAINGSLFNGLYVIAGRPAMGKGVHMTELICRMAKKHDIGVINGEMTDEQLLTRIGCNLMGIDNFLFKKNPSLVTTEEQGVLHEAMNEALTLKLHIEQSRYIHKIANKIKLWVDKYNVKCVLADFLTLFKIPPELDRYYTATQRVDYILDVFTNICKEQKIPVILYVQMNREILGRHGTKEPNLGDLKQSGSIEELAYQVSFLHRPEYYDPQAITDEMGENTKGLMYQIIAKHRDGGVGRIKHKAILQCSQLRDWTSGSFISNDTTLPF
jgi:replicative DNA helicase